MNEQFLEWFNSSPWAGAGKDAGELAEAAWSAGMQAYAKGSEEDKNAVIWRLREICAEPYKRKNGHSMTLARGWAWEMVQFIHHAVSDIITVKKIFPAEELQKILSDPEKKEQAKNLGWPITNQQPQQKHEHRND